MKRVMLAFLSLALSLQLFACKNGKEPNSLQDEETTVPITEAETIRPEEPKQNILNIDNYKNPIIGANEQYTWFDCGVGDPFVMRFNGRYYLYCSTKDGWVGIQCWSSENLVDWTYRGLCANEQLTMGAYAPEVVYYNGYFYMYTSPEGQGHYVLKSDSPTGPFVAITENFGLSIDGHVFIDDDGKWYFYSAAQGGINVYPMSSPSKVNKSAGKKIACDMNGWTEGPMVVKYNGTYYLTYTGNHVWSPGYRINYAISNDSPLAFQPATNNPLLLSTDKQTVMGIGHSSTVVGPNLDEYYIVYHSSKAIPKRSMNIDRIVFNGTDTYVLGPTTDMQQAPQMPDVYSRFEKVSDLDGWEVTSGELLNGALVLGAGGRVLSKESLRGDYTAEYNLKSVSDKAGILYGYLDDQNYGRAVYNAESSELTVEFTVQGNTTQKKILLNASFSEPLRNDALIKLNVRKNGNEYTFFVNNREVLRIESELGSGAFGGFCEEGSASVGFLGATNASMQSSIKDVYKPVESIIPAFSCIDDGAEIKLDDGVQYLHAVSDEKYAYNVNVSKKGSYDFVIEYSASEDCLIEVYQYGKKLGEVALSATGGVVERIAARSMELTAGIGTVSFLVKHGNADIMNFTFHSAESVEKITYSFKGSVIPVYKDGDWRVENGCLILNSNYGKYMVGSEDWGNYVVESDITITSDSINAGLCFRVSNPATLEDQVKTGSDYLQGYFVGFSNGAIVLGKHNYNWKELKRVGFSTQKNKTYRIKVEVTENHFRISIDGKVIMTYTDEDAPFLHGMVGYRAHACKMEADNLTIYPIS